MKLYPRIKKKKRYRRECYNCKFYYPDNKKKKQQCPYPESWDRYVHHFLCESFEFCSTLKCI